MEIGNVVFVEFQTDDNEPESQECDQAALAALEAEIRRNRGLIEGLAELLAKLACGPAGSACPVRISDSEEPSPAPHTASETSLV